MKEIVQVSVGAFSIHTEYTIQEKIQEYCSKFRVKCSMENKHVLFGDKFIVILDGQEEDIKSLIKLLRTNFKVKIF